MKSLTGVPIKNEEEIFEWHWRLTSLRVWESNQDYEREWKTWENNSNLIVQFLVPCSLLCILTLYPALVRDLLTKLIPEDLKQIWIIIDDKKLEILLMIMETRKFGMTKYLIHIKIFLSFFIRPANCNASLNRIILGESLYNLPLLCSFCTQRVLFKTILINFSVLSPL